MGIYNVIARGGGADGLGYGDGRSADGGWIWRGPVRYIRARGGWVVVPTWGGGGRAG